MPSSHAISEGPCLAPEDWSGLIPAPSGGIKSSTVLAVMPAVRTAVTTDYNGVGKIQYLLGQRNITILDSQYSDQVVLTVLIPEEGKRTAS